jgi:hypothetical protein
MVAGGSQGEGGGSDWHHDVFVPMTITGAEGR